MIPAIVTTEDALFNGQLRLLQPATGHRAGTDAVLLAAATPHGAHRIADLGASTGAVGLRIAQMNADATVTLIEREAGMMELADRNIVANTLTGRVTLRKADVFQLGKAVDLREVFDCVLTNPPFFKAGGIRVSPDPKRAAAHVLEGSLSDWIRNAVTILAPKGQLLVLHRADAVEELLAACARRLGEIRLRFIHPDRDSPAIRVILRARKGSRAPLAILPPVILHELGRHGPGRVFTAEVAALHRGECRLDMVEKETGGKTRPS